MDFAKHRQAMVAQLRERQEVGEAVAEAMLAVPRHLFLPEVEPEAAYRDEAIVTKRDAEGRPISSSSQPAIMAIMLDQLGVEPGHQVLEIGAGTGYNAALLARLAGPDGRVVSVDIDEDTVARAGAHLSQAGFPQVEVVCRDGAEGYEELAPYDRLIATVGVWDLAPAWLEQLREDGRLVVPLDLRGMQVSAAMERADGHWVSRSVAPCGFMRMRGPFAGTEVVMALPGKPELVLGLPEPREVGDVAAALDSPPAEVAVTLERPVATADAGMNIALWLALHEPRCCAVMGKLGGGYGMTAGLVEGDSIALLFLRDSVIAAGHGPGGSELADELAAHVRAWDEAGRPQAGNLRIEAHQGAPPDPGDRIVIAKRHTTLLVTYA